MGQRVLWQMDHHRGGHGALNCPLLMALDGPLDVGALQAAVDRIALRHESLRTTFAGRGARLRQRIHSTPLPLPIAEADLAVPGASDERVREAIATEVQTRCDPGERPVRLTLWRTAAERHLLCLNMHHLVTDGWSTAVIADELGRLYAHLVAGAAGLEPAGWQYDEWAAWHRAQLQGDSLRRLRDYWRRRLAGATMPALPRRDSDVALLERRTAVQRATIGAAAVAGLRELARRRNTALFSVTLAVLYAALQRDVGGRDPTVASIFANRGRREARATVGFLSNMVVLRSRARAGADLDELLRAADDAVIGAFAHQELPFQMLALDTIDPASARPDSVVFQLFAGPMQTAERAGVVFEPIIDVPDGIGSRWEFELSLFPAGDGLAVLLCYAEDLYEPGWVGDFLARYVALAEDVAREPAAQVLA